MRRRVAIWNCPLGWPSHSQSSGGPVFLGAVQDRCRRSAARQPTGGPKVVERVAPRPRNSGQRLLLGLRRQPLSPSCRCSCSQQPRRRKPSAGIRSAWARSWEQRSTTPWPRFFISTRSVTFIQRLMAEPRCQRPIGDDLANDFILELPQGYDTVVGERASVASSR